MYWTNKQRRHDAVCFNEKMSDSEYHDKELRQEDNYTFYRASVVADQFKPAYTEEEMVLR